jgi:dihydroorotase
VSENATTTSYDLLFKGGFVIDPANRRAALLDVALAGKRIAAVAPDIAPASAATVVDVTGCYVTPGLIDMHVHVGPDFGGWIMADPHSFPSGVTTFVDAGSPGANTFESFKSEWIDKSKTRILAFLNVVDNGMNDVDENTVARMRPDAAAEMACRYSDLIVGIKAAHYWVQGAYDADHQPWDNVERAVQAGELCHKPVMVDFWPRLPERSYRELLMSKLRPGDIHTHVFGQPFPILAENGRVNELMWEARDRGILFDLGHGGASFVWRNAQPAAQQGFYPDSISTDLHRGSLHKAISQIECMSKFLNLGLSVEDVVRLSTVAPAAEINHPELGTLTVGSEADVAVLRLHEGECGFVDSLLTRLSGTKRLECLLTLRAGEAVHDPNGLTKPDWHRAPLGYWFNSANPMPDYYVNKIKKGQLR